MKIDIYRIITINKIQIVTSLLSPRLPDASVSQGSVGVGNEIIVETVVYKLIYSLLKKRKEQAENTYIL